MVARRATAFGAFKPSPAVAPGAYCVPLKRLCPWAAEGLPRLTAGVGATGVVPRTPLKREPQTSGDPMVSGIAGRHDCVVLRIEEHVVLGPQRHADPGAQH